MTIKELDFDEHLRHTMVAVDFVHCLFSSSGHPVGIQKFGRTQAEIEKQLEHLVNALIFTLGRCQSMIF